MSDQAKATQPDDVSARPLVSIVTPAFNEAPNLKELHKRLIQVMDGLEVDWEWLIIDDHSPDGTFDFIRIAAGADPRVRGLRLSRNSGSHTALTCGLHHAAGQAVIIMAADLQDPPETIPELIERWQEGNQVVWAVRGARLGESASKKAASKLYYFIMRRLVGLKEMPPTGADFLLMDRAVVDAFSRFREQHVSILALISWMGFRQTEVRYDKQPRLHGVSGWSLKKKLKLAVDSVTAFTHLPIRFMSYLGMTIALLGFIYALVLVANWLAGKPPLGWTELMCGVLIIGGIQIMMLGILGEYTWRALDETRRRPAYMIEAVAGKEPERPVQPAGADRDEVVEDTDPPRV